MAGEGEVVPSAVASGRRPRLPPTAPPAELDLSWAQVHRFRVGRHSLAKRSARGSAEQVLRRIGGVQAQVPSAAELSIWSRVAGWRAGELSRRMDEDRSLVRTWCMRRTLFIVPARDLALFSRGTQRRAEKEIAWARRHGISAGELDRLLDAVGEGLEQPCTRRELSAHVAERLGRPLAARQGYGWGSRRSVPAVKVGRWNVPAPYMLQLFGARLPVCLGPGSGAEATYVRGDRWVRGFRDRDVPGAEDELLRLYLGAYGPASPADFARWAGIGVTASSAIWKRLGDAIAPVEVEGWRAGLLRSDLPAMVDTAEAPASVRLLPYFDTYLLGHESRRHLVGAAHHRRVYRDAGWIAPTLLVDGRVAATWSSEVVGPRLRVRLEPLERLPRSTLVQVRVEANAVAEFLGCTGADVRSVGG